MRTAIAARPDHSFDDFVVARSTRLLRSAYLLCGHRQEAEDLLQVALVRVAHHWDRARAAPDAYAYRVLVNLSRDRGRQTRRRPVMLALGGHETPGVIGDPADTVGDREAMAQALARLPTRQREAVTLRFLADLSVEQTAAAMGTSAGAVKTHTSRALAHLRRALTESPEVGRAH